MTRTKPCATYHPPNVTGGRCVDCDGTPADHPPSPPLDAPPASAPWDERHRREARILLRRLSLAAEIAGDARAAYVWGVRAEVAIRSEARLCDLLGGPGLPYLDAAEIRRKVRGVRDLAEGRAVRETSERGDVIDPDGRRMLGLATEEDGHVWAGKRNAMLDKIKSVRPRYRIVRVKVTRIRRAPP